MLVLTRRVGEEILIGDNVRVRIVAVQNQRVRLAVAAPLQVTVHRKEVHQRIQGLHDRTGNAEQIKNAARSK